MSGKIGLNGQEATAALKKAENSYDKIMAEMVNRMQSGVIDQITNSWYGNDAVQFMNKVFKEAISGTNAQIEGVFNSINATVTQNAENFDREHETQVFQRVPHNTVSDTTTCEGTKPDLNSFVGISDPSLFESAKHNFAMITDAVMQALQDAVAAAQNSGFYGGNQQEALVNSMQQIKNNLSNLTNELNAATAKKLQEAHEREQAIAAANASTFGN